MKFLRRLAIAFYRLLFGFPVRPRSRVRRSRFYAHKLESNEVDEYDDFDHQNEFDSQDDLNTQIVTSYNRHLTTQSYPLQTSYYPSLYQSSYYPEILQWQDVDDEYDEDYQDEYDEDALGDSYGTVEYRFETFGGDMFIEYSYEGDLDEQEIVQALNWLWTSSADRFNPNRSNVLTGTLRMPLPSRSINLL